MFALHCLARSESASLLCPRRRSPSRSPRRAPAETRPCSARRTESGSAAGPPTPGAPAGAQPSPCRTRPSAQPLRPSACPARGTPPRTHPGPPETRTRPLQPCPVQSALRWRGRAPAPQPAGGFGGSRRAAAIGRGPVEALGDFDSGRLGARFKPFVGRAQPLRACRRAH